MSSTIPAFRPIQIFPIWLNALTTAKVENLTKSELYSFFSNVYNSLAISMMIKYACKEDLFGNCGPISGIRDIGTLIPYRAVWDKPAGVVAGKIWSLQDVEDYLLSPVDPNIKPDPRVHSAIVCASVSCPNVRRGAYNYTHLDSQFNESFNNWLSNPKKGMLVDTASSTVTLSLIFSWYDSMFSGYFEDGKGSVLRFIVLYLDRNSTSYEWLKAHQDTASIDYFDYDWNANVDGKLPCYSTARPCYPLWALLVTLGAFLVVVVIVSIVIVVKKRRARRHTYHRINIS